MVEGVPAPQFPFDSYLNSYQQSRPKYVAGQALGDLGQMIPGMIQMYQKQQEDQKVKALLKQLQDAMSGQGAPQQGPPLAPMGTPQPNTSLIPPGQPMTAGGSNIGQDVQMPQPIPMQGPGQPTSGIGAPAQDNNKLINSLLMQIDPTGAAYKNYATAQKDQNTATDMPESMTDVYRNAKGDYSDVQKPGYTKVGRVPLKEAYQYKMAGSLADKKAGIKGTQDLKKEWDEITKSINPFKPTGFGAASSVFAKAANANRAAASGVKLLRKKDLTWKELNAFVNSDFANLQRGGSPTDIQLSEANYNNLMSGVGRFKEYVNSKPATGLVNDETRKQMEENFKELINIDNAIIDDAIDYQESAHPDAIQAFPTRWNSVKKSAQKIKTLVEFDKDSGSAGGDISSMSDEELKKVMAGGK